MFHLPIRNGTYDGILSGECRALVVKRPFPPLRRHDFLKLVADDEREVIVRVTWVETAGNDYFVFTIVTSRPSELTATTRCDECQGPAEFSCNCVRCLREPEESERYHACTNHQNEVADRHARVRYIEPYWVRR
jgi:hypothetical protein